ncbi:hypothetical protein RFI_40373 [Reticulomyxa filosa]|uniref:Uncharacterized protein n=1 Tax=Reticulomyxa filosa TaxID=46433 RepID=X6L6X9_RETFI|nr:hypothetical protein RFI_40373 [Reticulomyxa filosa]|eukprot:ETN97157.1 hypothetical protein RFI_40373 [Reticulomyxa filosa]
MRVKWVKKEHLVDVLDIEQLKLIEKAFTDIDSKNQLLQSLSATVDNYEKEIASKQTEIKDLIIQMKDICSDFNYAKEIDLSMKILIHTTFEYFKKLKSFDIVEPIHFFEIEFILLFLLTHQIITIFRIKRDYNFILFYNLRCLRHSN